jgi:hypothetical protein
MTGTITPRDDYLHEPSDNYLWNESSWFSFRVPEREINGFVHTSHWANLNQTVAGIAVYDGSGADVYDCLHYDYGAPTSMTPTTGTEAFDYTTSTGLTMKCVEPLHRFAISYDRNGCELDLRWESAMDPFNAGFPPGSEGWGPNHYEQAGRMTGTLRIGGEEYAVECGSNRDHSWGPRDYLERSEEAFPRHDFPWFNDGHGYAMNMYTLPEKPPADDPIIGCTDPAIGGWILRDGQVSRIVSGFRRAVERRPDGVPSRVAMEGTDELGRAFAAEGRVANVLKWTGLPGLLVFWSMVEWTLDDGRTIWGETGEVFPSARGRRFLRSLK